MMYISIYLDPPYCRVDLELPDPVLRGPCLLGPGLLPLLRPPGAVPRAMPYTPLHQGPLHPVYSSKHQKNFSKMTQIVEGGR